jgi:galactose mutarotase-like enzyme
MDLANRPPQDKPAAAPRRRRWTSSGFFTPGLIAVFCLCILFATHERGHGNYHRLRSAVISSPPEPEQGPTGPGGEDAIVLRRSATAVGDQPEFLSATLLPGRGMNVLQITAAIPGHGEVPLLVSPTLGDTGRLLTGSGADANGSVSTTLGGAFAAPWAGHLVGSPSSSQDTLEGVWQGQRISFPAQRPGSTVSTEGLLLDRAADSVNSQSIPNGQSATAVYRAGNFNGAWPSNMDVTILIELSGHTMDLTVTAQNTGQAPTPVGLGWHPLFALPGGDRDDVRLTIPSITSMEIDRRTGIPTGRIVSVANTPADLIRARGTKLGTQSIDETYTNLQTSLLADGPIAELRNPAFGYGLRIMPLSSSIKFLHVIAPAGQNWVSIDPDTNADDPFGRMWAGPEQTGMVTLQPGDTMQWRVRVEIFSMDTADSENTAAP